MKMKLPDQGDPDLDMAPMIDMTFLLLIYFICTCTLIMPEADLGIRLPGMIAQATTVDMPDEQMIEVRKTGEVYLNDRSFDSSTSTDLPDLVATLTRYRLSAEAASGKALITIMADGDTSHQRVIDVMNACAAAKLKDISFAGASE
ncbi:MAG: biopolymer transporter ExbD [Lentisphaerae bacterium]|nr:biopolymer transporter ExbD [Lentisphaerota bacterium]